MEGEEDVEGGIVSEIQEFLAPVTFAKNIFKTPTRSGIGCNSISINYVVGELIFYI